MSENSVEKARSARFDQSANLDQLCSSVTRLLGCEAALILYSVGNVKRILGSDGIPSRFKSYEFDFSNAPFGKAERMEALDLAPQDPLALIGHKLGIENCCWFLREPVFSDRKISVALYALGVTPRARTNRQEKSVLAKIVALVKKEVALKRAQLATLERNITVLLPLSDLASEVTEAKRPEFLLDEKLKIIAASRSAAALLGHKHSQVIGKRHQDFDVPASEAIAWLYGRAITTRISPPEFEIFHRDKDGDHRIFRLNVSPLSPTDTPDYFLHVTITDVSEIDEQTQKMNSVAAAARRKGSSHRKEPSLTFLLETLVKRRAIRERKNVSYLTLRSWRQPIREYQIEALKALKQNMPAEMAPAIAAEMASEIGNLVGAGAFRAIVPMPCSNAQNSTCLSREIARSLGTLLNLPVIMALTAPKSEGSSHPKKNLRRAKMSMKDDVAGPVILVDDVATSGAHVEEAVHLLKPSCTAVLPVVWISGDKA